MAYIGRQPTVGNFRICDAISVVNGQAAYTMQVGGTNVIPESHNNMIVSVNGVIQKPGSSFTVSSSTITFSSNLSTGDVIDFIQILGGVANIGTPSDGTVTSAKINYPLTTFSSTGIDDNGSSTAIYIDSSERVTMPSQPAFSVTAGMNNIPLSTQTTVELGSERFDVGSNLSSNTFTAPITGKYLFTYMLYFTQLDSDHTTLDVHFKTSNKQYQQTWSPDHFLNSDSNFSVSSSIIADMDANDTMYVAVYTVGGSAQTDIHADSQVSGCLLL